MRLCDGGLIPSLLAATCFAQPSIESRMLAAHNSIRAPLKLHPLTWSEKLAGYALEWAETLLVEDKFFHRPKSGYGENLFAITGGGASPEQVVEAWAVESRDYDFRSNTCRAKCGHYTQLVWRDTRQVGCAVARNFRREVWVCNYAPRGNYVGERPYE